MTHEVLSAIAGIGIYPTISLVFFVAVFAGTLWRVARMSPDHADELAALPLDGETADAIPEKDPR